MLTHHVALGGLIALAMVAVVLARLNRLDFPLSPDEGGFLTVGGAWQAGGDHLYGDHWVDRPPLLIAIFRLAEATGGLLSLRIIGLLTAALIVLLAAQVAGLIAGARAAVVAAWAAALMLATPVIMNGRVDGELLAAPFVLAGVAAAVAALRPSPRTAPTLLFAALAGAAGLAAVMVKQNFLDVVVFAVVSVIAALAGRVIDPRQALVFAGGFLGGLVLSCAAMLLWAWSQGTSAVDLYQALYPFRIEAVQAINPDAPSIAERRTILYWAALGSGLLPLAIIALPLLRRRPHPALCGMFAVVAYGVFSVLAGASAWLHYLVQLCGPVAVLAGVAVAVFGRRGRTVVAVTLGIVLVVGAVTYEVKRHVPIPDSRVVAGEALAAAARPDDSLVVFPFGANLGYASGLESRYPYLWLLPALVRDNDLSTLQETVAGPSAPVWVVLTARPKSWPGYGFSGPTDLLDERYDEVGELCGRPVYLLRGTDREPPDNPCR